MLPYTGMWTTGFKYVIWQKMEAINFTHVCKTGNCNDADLLQ